MFSHRFRQGRAGQMSGYTLPEALLSVSSCLLTSAQASRVHVFCFSSVFTNLNARSQQFLQLAWSDVPPHAAVNVASMASLRRPRAVAPLTSFLVCIAEPSSSGNNTKGFGLTLKRERYDFPKVSLKFCLFFLVLKASDADNAKYYMVFLCAFALLLRCCGSQGEGCCFMCRFGHEDLASFSEPGVPTEYCHLLHLRCCSLSCQVGSAPRLVLLVKLVWCMHRAGRWYDKRDAVEVQVPRKRVFLVCIICMSRAWPALLPTAVVAGEVRWWVPHQGQ